MDSEPTLHLRAAEYSGSNPITGSITLEIADQVIEAELTASLTEAPFAAQLPIFQAIADELVVRGVAREAAGGRMVSCRPGCGACCRYAVPLAAVEARAIAALVAAMPEARRISVTARFAAARAALAAAGLSSDAAAFAATAPPDRERFVSRYIGLGLACPFLEAETCSIYADRPLVCREYLVSSPADACSDPKHDTVRGIPLAGRLSRAVMARCAEIESHGTVLLVDALAFAAAHLPAEPEYPGIELVLTTIAKLPGRSDGN